MLARDGHTGRHMKPCLYEGKMANISRRKLFGWPGLGAGAAVSLSVAPTAAEPKVIERVPAEGETRMVFSHMEASNSGVSGFSAAVEVYKTERWDGSRWVPMGQSRMFPNGLA